MLLWLSGLTLMAPLLATAIGRPMGWAWLKPYALGAMPVAVVLGPIFAILAVIVATPTVRKPASVEVGDDVLTIEAQGRVRRIPRADIDGGMLVPSQKQPFVELYLRGGEVLRFAVRDEPAAMELLDALDIGPSERRVHVTLSSPQRVALVAAGRGALVIMTCFMLLGFLVGAYQNAFGSKLPPVFLGPWLAMVVGGIVGWNRMSRPTEVTVGAEGVRIVTAWREHVLSYAQLEAVQVSGRTLALTEKTGATTNIDMSRWVDGGAAASDKLQGLARRIRDGMNAIQTTPDRVAERLERGGRSVADWRAALAELFGGGAGYRSATLARDVAEQVLDDGAAPVERRIGAALALASQGGDEAKSRIRIAANRTTDEKLRVVLDAVAEEQLEEDQIAEALDEQV
jgi:hypothetical protein